MHRIGGFMAQEEAVGSGFAQAAIGRFAFFAHGKRDGAIGPARLHLADERAEAVVREPAVFTALHDKGTEAEAVAVFTAFKDLLRREAVALGPVVAASDTAVSAVLAAEIRDLDEPANVDALAEMLLCAGPGAAEQLFAQGKAFFFAVTNGTAPGYVYNQEAIEEGGYEYGNSMFGHAAHLIVVDEFKNLIKGE